MSRLVPPTGIAARGELEVAAGSAGPARCGCRRLRRCGVLAVSLAAALACGGPVADASTRLDAPDRSPQPPAETSSPTIVRLDPRLDALVAPGTAVERIASGLVWVEGPLWDESLGALLFSDIPQNAVMSVIPGQAPTVHLRPSGYTGTEPFTGREPGSNGLLFDGDGGLLLCQHGDRRIARLAPDGSFQTVVDRYLGRRLNSPNDAVLRSNGDLYFTDPPFGLPGTFDDPSKELAWSGVYRLCSGCSEPELLVDDLSSPNGIAFSPDERVLYVSNADAKHPVWLAYPVDGDGRIRPGRILLDAGGSVTPSSGLPDGLEVDRDGNLFAAGPNGVWVITAEGDHLGTFELGGPTGNCAWGEDGRSLFVTAGSFVYRVRVLVGSSFRSHRVETSALDGVEARPRSKPESAASIQDA
jgi:gluconolactonase